MSQQRLDGRRLRVHVAEPGRSPLLNAGNGARPHQSPSPRKQPTGRRSRRYLRTTGQSLSDSWRTADGAQDRTLTMASIRKHGP